MTNFSEPTRSCESEHGSLTPSVPNGEDSGHFTGVCQFCQDDVPREWTRYGVMHQIVRDGAVVALVRCCDPDSFLLAVKGTP